MTDEWTYTNAEHTEARKGRWLATPETEDENGRLRHDDFDEPWFFESSGGRPINAGSYGWGPDVSAVLRDFLAWHAAQPAPIAVGDYVRLTGEDWGDDEGKVAQIIEVGGGPDYGYYRLSDGRGWADAPYLTRITVTADLDDPWNLPMPEVGEYGWFETRGGDVFAGAVAVIPLSEAVAKNLHGIAVDAENVLFLHHRESGWNSRPSLCDIAAWGTYDPADLTPAEPTTFGYVGYVTEADGDVWDVNRDIDGDYQMFRHIDGAYMLDMVWPDVLARGTFTAVER